MISILRFFILYSFSHFRTEKAKICITVISIAIGVATYFSIRLANVNALYSFSHSVESLSYGADVSVVSQSGSVDESLIETLISIPEIKKVWPYSSVFTFVRIGEEEKRVQIVGLDLFRVSVSKSSEANNANDTSTDIFSTVQFSGLISTQLGNTSDIIDLSLGTKTIPIKVAGRIEDESLSRVFGGNVIFLDISVFQELFSRFGSVDRFDITLSEISSKDDAIKVIKSRIPAQYNAVYATSLVDTGKSMTNAFRFNLNFLATISLLLASLLVYNTSNYFSLKRVREYTILSVVGLSRIPILSLGIFEAILLGVVGSMIGLCGGYFLTHILIHSLYETVSNLYVPVAASEVVFDYSVAFESFSCGILASICGSLIPQWEASRVSIISNLSYQNTESRFSKTLFLSLLCGLILTLISFSMQNIVIFEYNFAYAAPLFFTLGFILCIPFVFQQIVRLLIRVSHTRAFLMLRVSAQHIEKTLRRNLTSVISMVLALGFAIGITAMIMSFRSAVEYWMTRALCADVFISPSDSLASSDYLAIPEIVADTLSGRPEIEMVDAVHPRRVVFQGKTVDVAGVSFDIIRQTKRLDFIASDFYSETPIQETIFISEVFANKYALSVNQTIDIPTDIGIKKARIKAIFRDYSSDRGLIMIPLDEFKVHFPGALASGLSVYLKEGFSKSDVESILTAVFPQYTFVVRDNKMLAREVLVIFDNTFKITYALIGISFVISILAIINSILMLLLERKRDFLIFMSMGASMQFISRLVLLEAAIISFISVLIGLVFGLILAYFLVILVTPYFFGWSFNLLLPWNPIFLTLISTIVISLTVSYVTSRLTIRRISVQEMSYV